MRKRKKFRGRRQPKMRLPIPPKEGTHYVYKITVGNKVYTGYTSRNPHVRLSEHLENAEKGMKGKLYNALRAYGCQHEFEILKEFDNEYDALCYEILEIEKCSNRLNTSPGGEGRSMILHKVISEDGTTAVIRRARYAIRK